jgi:hypothetical protein
LISVFSTGSSLVTVSVLAVLIAAAGAFGARADDPDSGGDITVTVVDPSASPSPASSAAAGSGTATPGRGSNTGGGTGESSESGSTGGGDIGPTGAGVPSWIVVSGFDSGAHSELDPLRGWMHSTVTVANRSTTETVSGVLTFRLRSFLGGQLGPTVTRQITELRPGDTSEVSVDLVGVGQWPLVKSSVTFQQRGASHQSPIVREAWVLGFPWLLMVIAILAVAIVAVARIRRGAGVSVLQPEPAV